MRDSKRISRALEMIPLLWYGISCVRRDDRAAEGVRLEVVCTRKGTEGSNPSLSVKEVIMEEQVKAALENVRPSLQADGGDVEFVSVDNDGVVSVKLTGACGHCPMSQMTLKMGIENYLKKEIPQVTSVVGV